MSDISFILGSVEYLMCEVQVDSPGVTFVPADWAAKMYLADNATSVVIEDVAGADWKTAVLETVNSKHYAKALMHTDFAQGVGTYTAFVKLTPTAGSELPILKAVGTVTITGE